MSYVSGKVLRVMVCTGLFTATGCVSPPAPPGAVFEVEAPGAPSPLHFSLSPDGHDLVAWSAAGDGIALWTRPLDSLLGHIVPGTERARGGASGFPFWSPDSSFIGSFGNRNLQVTANAENAGIWIGSLDSDEPRFLVSSTAKAVFAPPDTILYVQGTTLMARKFDLRRLDFSGPPLAIVHNLAANERNSAAGFTVSANGVLAYLKGRPGGQIGSIPIVVAVNWRALQ